jgi:hypothetical protein
VTSAQSTLQALLLSKSGLGGGACAGVRVPVSGGGLINYVKSGTEGKPSLVLLQVDSFNNPSHLPFILLVFVMNGEGLAVKEKDKNLSSSVVSLLIRCFFLERNNE